MSREEDFKTLEQKALSLWKGRPDLLLKGIRKIITDIIKAMRKENFRRLQSPKEVPEKSQRLIKTFAIFVNQLLGHLGLDENQLDPENSTDLDMCAAVFYSLPNFEEYLKVTNSSSS